MIIEMLNNAPLTVWYTVYEEEGEQQPAGASDEGQGQNQPAGDTIPPELQEKVNAIIAAEKRKFQAEAQKAVQEVKNLQTKVAMTTEERTELESRLENIQKTLQTKEEQARDKTVKLERQYQTQIAELTKERDSWKTKHIDAQITQSIIQAAVEHKAFNPEQMIAILRPQVQLVEDFDDTGKPTGKTVPKVDFTTYDEDNKPKQLTLTVQEAMKQMTTMDQYLNLFKGEGVGGFGRRNDAPVGEKDVVALAKDPKSFREAYKKGKINLGG